MAKARDYIDPLIAALLRVDRLAAERIVSSAFKAATLDEVVATLIAPSLERIGDNWIKGTTSLSEIYMSSRICEELMKSAVPTGSPLKTGQPKMAIVALLDYHLLGKRLVQLMLHSSGYEVADYGQGATPEDVVNWVRRDQIEVLLISTLMLPSALKIKELKKLLQGAHLNPRLVVGGAPFRFDDELWKEVGADAMGYAASDALKIIGAMTARKEASHAA